jgi:hypothetical protein
VWEDDFWKARNAVLAEATADWVPVLDADEMLDADAGLAIPALLQARGVAAYEVTI